MRHHDPATVKAGIHERLMEVAVSDARALGPALARLYAGDALFRGSHPIEDVRGVEAIAAEVWAPIKAALRDLIRHDDILIGGHAFDSDWVAATGYLHGTFVAGIYGIPATGNWASLRYGEFHRITGGAVAESLVLFDFVDLMRQAGVSPWRRGLGVETLMPGPRSRDGLVLAAEDPAESRRTLELVEAMIFDGLLKYDGVDHRSVGMERYWTSDMMWYGPGLIGATMGLDKFMALHQEHWQTAIISRGATPTREDKHNARFADGAYACIVGWPSIRATHGGDFLGLPASGQPVDIRVMDWWHRRGDKLDENWIFIDMPHLFLQLGVDLFARMAQPAGSARPLAGA